MVLSVLKVGHAVCSCQNQQGQKGLSTLDWRRKEKRFKSWEGSSSS